MIGSIFLGKQTTLYFLFAFTASDLEPQESQTETLGLHREDLASVEAYALRTTDPTPVIPA